MLMRILRLIAGWIISLIIAIVFFLFMFVFGHSRAWETLLPLWAKCCRLIFGIQIKIEGEQWLKGPAIFLMAHRTAADIFVLPSVTPAKSTFIAKAEVAKVPFVAQAMRAANCIFVDRKNRESAIASIRAGLDKLPKDYSLLIFPEGTRAHTHAVLPIKKGPLYMAKESGLPIVIIGQSGAEKIGMGKSILLSSGTIKLCVSEPMANIDWDHISTDHVAETIRIKMQELCDRAANM